MTIGYDIFVAASNSKPRAKAKADYVCTGVHDELTIQKAIDEAVKEGVGVLLADGKYNMEGFYDFGDGGPKTALCFPRITREFAFFGESYSDGVEPDGEQNETAILYVTEAALDTIGDGEYDVLRGAWTERGILNGSALHLNNLCVALANNQHPVRCLDLRRTDAPYIENVRLRGVYDAAFAKAFDIPVKGCIGMTMTDGSNNARADYINVFARCFYEGIQAGGEHSVCINCGASAGAYGWTFGNYDFHCGFNHPITLINCLDETNIHLPYFGDCGDHDYDGKLLRGRQEVTMISFNLEHFDSQSPGGKMGDLMREKVPGSWCGSIDFTYQPDWCHTNDIACRMWENDGSGVNIRTRNNCHKAVCTTAERMSYFPMYGETIFDTDLNKTVICLDPEKGMWVDAMGKQV